MDFTTIFIIGIVIAVLGSLGSLLFWGGLAYFGFKAASRYQTEMNSIMNNYLSTLSNLQRNYGSSIPPEAQNQVYTQFLQAQNQLNHLNDLSQQKHDLFVSDMLGQASSMGIDTSNWNY